MIATISGTVTELSSSGCVVEVSGFGILVYITRSTAERMKVGENKLLFTALVPREDSISLYGFLDFEEKRLFDLLLSVTGVGPKLALAVLSELSISEIAQAVTEENYEVFNSVSGIGPKTAKLIVLSLGGKVDNPSSNDSSNLSDIIIALTGLGWGEKEVRQALKDIDLEEIGKEESLRLALRTLGELKGKKR